MAAKAPGAVLLAQALISIVAERLVSPQRFDMPRTAAQRGSLANPPARGPTPATLTGLREPYGEFWVGGLKEVRAPSV